MRKLPILLFTAVFALSLALPAYAAESSNEELKAASQYLNSHGIMVGDGEGNMNFSAPLTRAHLATILARIHGGSEQVESNRVFYAAQCKFQDVPDWARQYVGYCAYHGLMAGYGGELFGAEDPVTPAAAYALSQSLDLPDLMWDYNSACSVACDLGLITSAMTAKGTVSRGDLAVMLYRTLTGIDQGTSAGADEATVSISSYKGNVLEVGTRSGLMVYPSDTVLELVSSNPDVLAVEQIAGNWVAVAKSPGSARVSLLRQTGSRAISRSRYPVLSETGRISEPEPITQIIWRFEKRSLHLSTRSGRNMACPRLQPNSRSWMQHRITPPGVIPGMTARKSVSWFSHTGIHTGLPRP